MKSQCFVPIRVRRRNSSRQHCVVNTRVKNVFLLKKWQKKNLLEYEVVRMRAVDGSFAIGRNMFHFFSSSIWYCQKDLFVIAKKDSLPVYSRERKNGKWKKILAIIFQLLNEFQRKNKLNEKKHLRWIINTSIGMKHALYPFATRFLLLFHRYRGLVIKTVQFYQCVVIHKPYNSYNNLTNLMRNNRAYWWVLSQN